MGNEMKMSDVFGLPLAVCSTNPQMITAKPTRKGVIVHHSATIRSPQHSEVAYAAHAINNHDRLVEENAKLREALQECVEALDGSYDVTEWPANGQGRCDIASNKAKLLLIGD